MIIWQTTLSWLVLRSISESFLKQGCVHQWHHQLLFMTPSAWHSTSSSNSWLWNLDLLLHSMQSMGSDWKPCVERTNDPHIAKEQYTLNSTLDPFVRLASGKNAPRKGMVNSIKLKAGLPWLRKIESCGITILTLSTHKVVLGYSPYFDEKCFQLGCKMILQPIIFILFFSLTKQSKMRKTVLRKNILRPSKRRLKEKRTASTE